MRKALRNVVLTVMSFWEVGKSATRDEMKYKKGRAELIKRLTQRLSCLLVPCQLVYELNYRLLKAAAALVVFRGEVLPLAGHLFVFFQLGV